MSTPVELGAEFLDVEVPGWYNRIDLDNLNILYDGKCVLCQLLDRSFVGGLREFGTGWDWAEDHGFAVSAGTTPASHASFAARADAVTNEWRQLIIARRTGVGLSKEGKSE